MRESDRFSQPVKVERRLAAYLTAACSRWKGREIRLDPARIASTFGVSLRTVRRSLAELKSDARFVWRRARRGRSFALFCQLQGARVQGDTPHYREESPTEIKDSSPRWRAFRKDSSGVKRLAWAVARNDLAELHWDNCKVNHRAPFCVRLVLDALHAGRFVEDIVKAYDTALHHYHRIATDQGCTEGHLLRYEPSGVVSMARRLLSSFS